MSARNKHLNLCGPTIRRLRCNRGWSQSQLALKCQLAGWDASRDIVARIEMKCRAVSDIDLVNLGKIFGVSIDELVPKT